MEEKYERMDDDAQKIIDGFNEHSRNAGRMTLFVTYTAIPSNREIVKDFAEYAYNEANNNYLSAIKQLMDNKRFTDHIIELEQRVYEVETKMDMLRDYALKTMEKINDGIQKESEEGNNGSKGPKFF